MDREEHEALRIHAPGSIFVRTLENEGIDPDKNSCGETPFTMVARCSSKEIVKLIISSGADIHCCNERGWSVLHRASGGSQIKIVQCLVNKVVALDVKESDDRTSSLSAADSSHSEVVSLINTGADIHCYNDFDDKTVLHYVSRKEWSDIVQHLLIGGVAQGVERLNGQTPLMMAALRSCRKVAELLIGSGADIHCCDNDGQTVLHYASRQRSVEMVRYLVNKGVSLDVKKSDGQTPLMLAAKLSHRGIVELLVESGADIHCCDNVGQTVLHYASWQESVEIVQYLVNKGVSLDVKKSDGQTPLMLAAERSHRGIVELLMNSGADIHCCNDWGWTVLHYVSYNGWLEIVQYLVNKGVSLDVKNSDGKTPLMLAAEGSHKRIVELLINSGADIHCCNDRGWTALHYASSRDWKDVVVLLLMESRGININVQTSDGKTPLHFAIHKGAMEIVHYLLKAGADCNLEDNDGESPFSFLIKKRWCRVDTIKLCIEGGAYVNAPDYYKLFEKRLLKMLILEDVKLCTQSVINKFNYKDLPLLYKKLGSVQKLPRIDKLKIGNRCGMALSVRQAVAHEILAKGFCNLVEMVPSVLCILCVKSLIEN